MTAAIRMLKALLSGSILRVTNMAAQIAVGVVMVPFIVEALGDRMFGLWSLIATLIGYYGVLDIGLSAAVTRYVAKAIGEHDFAECNRIFNTSLLAFSIIGVGVMLLAFGVGSAGALFFDERADTAVFFQVMLLLGAELSLSLPLRAFGGILQAQLRFDVSVGLQLLTLFIRTSLIVWVLSSDYGVVGLAWATFLSTLPGKVLLVYYSKKALPSLNVSYRNWDWDTLRELFSFGGFAFLTRTANLLRFQTDAVVISAFLGLAAVTHYKVASTLIRYFVQLMIACVGVFYPVFCRHGGENNKETVQEYFILSTRICVCISSFVAFGFIAWGGPFITRWMGTDYLDAYPPLMLLTVAAVIDMWQQPLPGVLIATGRPRISAVCSSVEGVLNLILSLLLVGPFGLVGVALGTLIPSLLVRLILQPAWGCGALSIARAAYYKRLARTVLSTCVALVIPYGITIQLVAPSYLALVLVALLSGLSYVLALCVLELDRSELRGLWAFLFPRLRLRKATS